MCQYTVITVNIPYSWLVQNIVIIHMYNKTLYAHAISQIFEHAFSKIFVTLNMNY